MIAVTNETRIPSIPARDKVVYANRMSEEGELDEDEKILQATEAIYDNMPNLKCVTRVFIVDKIRESVAALTEDPEALYREFFVRMSPHGLSELYEMIATTSDSGGQTIRALIPFLNLRFYVLALLLGGISTICLK